MASPPSFNPLRRPFLERMVTAGIQKHLASAEMDLNNAPNPSQASSEPPPLSGSGKPFSASEPASSISSTPVGSRYSSLVSSCETNRKQDDQRWAKLYADSRTVFASDDISNAIRRMGARDEGFLNKFIGRRDAIVRSDLARLESELDSAVASELEQNKGLRGELRGTYWLETLANWGLPTSRDRSSEYVWRRGNERGLEKTANNDKFRRLDAFLCAPTALIPRRQNLLALVEFTESALPSFKDTNRTLGNTTAESQKLRQLVTNLVDLIQADQPTRIFAAGIGFFKGDLNEPGGTRRKRRSAVLVLIDHEAISLYRIWDCFGENLPTTIALLDSLRSASLDALGFSPFFDYTFDGPTHEESLLSLDLPTFIKLERFPPSNFGDVTSTSGLGDVVPTHFQLPADACVAGFNGRHLLLGNSLSHVVASPFSRSTLIFRIAEETTPREVLLLKIQWGSASRASREKNVLSQLWEPVVTDAPAASASLSSVPSPPTSSIHTLLSSTSSSTTTSAPTTGSTLKTSTPLSFPASGLPTYAPQLITSYSCARLDCQRDGPSSSFTPRHLEFLVMKTPLDATPISKLRTAEHFLRALQQLVWAVVHASLRRVQHRDVSSGNVLATEDGTLVFIDWDCGAYLDNIVVGGEAHVRSGTLDTMAVDLLASDSDDEFQHQLYHDLESIVHLTLKVVTQKVPRTEKWSALLKRCYWGNAAFDIKEDALADVRRCFFSTTGVLDPKTTLGRMVAYLEGVGLGSVGDFITKISRLGKLDTGCGFGRSVDFPQGADGVAPLLELFSGGNLDEIWTPTGDGGTVEGNRGRDGSSRKRMSEVTTSSVGSRKKGKDGA